MNTRHPSGRDSTGHWGIKQSERWAYRLSSTLQSDVSFRAIVAEGARNPRRVVTSERHARSKEHPACKTLWRDPMSKRLFRFVPFLILAGCTNGANPNEPSAPVTNDLIGSGPFGLHPVLAANQKSPGVTVPTILSARADSDPGRAGLERGREYGDDRSRQRGEHRHRALRLRRRRSAYAGARRFAQRDSHRRSDQDRARQEHLPRALGQTGADPTTTTARTSCSRATRTRRRPAIITRVNLDADGAHRVTMLASHDRAGAPSRTSTARPGTRSRSGCSSRARTATPAVSSRRRSTPVGSSRTSRGAIGRGGYEGVQNDSAGNLWIVEDVGGASGRVHATRQAAEQLHLPLRPEADRTT